MHRLVVPFVAACLLVGVVAARAAPLPGELPGIPTTDCAERLDRFGDPLPERAVARIGTVRFRHEGDVSALAWSPDGKLLASGGHDPLVRLWDPRSGQEVRSISGHQGRSVWSLAFSPDGKTLVSVGGGQAQVWDAAEGRELRRLGKANSHLSHAIFSPDGKRLVITEMCSLRLWATDTWLEGDRLWHKEVGGGAVTFSEDGRLLASGDGMGDIVVWDLPARGSRRFSGGPPCVGGVALSPDGRVLAAAGTGGTVVAWEVETGTLLFRLQGEARGPAVNSVAFSPDGKTLAAAGQGTGVRLLEADTRRELSRFGEPDQDFRVVAFAPDGKALASCVGSAVRVWDLATGEEVLPPAGPRGPVEAVAFAPDGKCLAYAAAGDVLLLQVGTLKEVVRCTPREILPVRHLAFAPDGKTLTAAIRGGRVRFWDAASGKQTRAWVAHLPPPFEGYEVGLAAPDAQTVLTWTVEGKADHVVRVRDRRTDRELLQLTARGGGDPEEVAVSPDGRVLALAAREGPIRLFRLDTARALAGAVEFLSAVHGDDPLYGVMPEWESCLEGEGLRVAGLAFAPDGRTLASVGGDGRLRLWELATGRQRAAFPIPEDCTGCTFSPDGQFVATWSERGAVCLWDAATGEEACRLDGHRGAVNQAAFSPDGRLLASAGADTTVLLWDVADLVRRTPEVPLPAAEWERCWDALGGGDGPRAQKALAALQRAGKQTAEYASQHLGPVTTPTPREVARLLADLDSNRFEVRERATRELAERIELVAPAVRAALTGEPSPEARRRLESLRRAAEDGTWSPESLRALRVVEVLERIGSEEARAVLGAVAEGAPEARLTREAKASLDRLAVRARAAP
jgi:WD40 repeat protein